MTFARQTPPREVLIQLARDHAVPPEIAERFGLTPPAQPDPNVRADARL